MFISGVKDVLLRGLYLDDKRYFGERTVVLYSSGGSRFLQLATLYSLRRLLALRVGISGKMNY